MNLKALTATCANILFNGKAQTEQYNQSWKEQGVQGIIDLIYLDPPFNSNRNYGHPTAKAKKSETGSMDAFSDMWTYDDQAIQRVQNICNSYHPARELIKALKPYLHKHDSGMLAYLSYMADRLRLFHGLLRDTGSIYLHCDPYANYYLRLLMDAIFGAKNFRNEIVWHYPNRLSQKGFPFPKLHDTILCYSKSDQFVKKELLDKTWVPSNAQLRRQEKGYEYYKGTLVVYDEKKARDAGIDLDNIDFKRGKTGRKRINSVWILDAISSMAKEREGYKTQKPLKLLDRIIQASTNEGDLVLDPFAGCGTTMHAAVKNKRRFIGIDVSVFTIYEVTRKRLKLKCGLDVPIYGIPVDFAGANLLAKQDKSKFEAWAAESLNFGNIGIISNKIKSHDGGIDGSGLLYGETEDGDDKIIVQVKGGKFTINDVRAFKDRINSLDEVAAGIFITLDGDNPKAPNGFRWTKGMESEARECGTFKMANGEQSFRRMQHWSVRDRFKGKDKKGVYPEMPIMINPYNDKPMLEIGSTVPSKPIMKPSKPAKRNRRRNGKTKPDLF